MNFCTYAGSRLKAGRRMESCPTPGDRNTMPRIVSLIASATEIVDALGQIGNLVGRSHECDYPEAVKKV